MPFRKCDACDGKGKNTRGARCMTCNGLGKVEISEEEIVDEDYDIVDEYEDELEIPDEGLFDEDLIKP